MGQTRLERPKKGDRATHEWACSVVDAIRELQDSPRVIAPLISRDGAIGFGDNYGLRLVQATSTISAMVGTTMGSGSVKFLVSPGGIVADNAGSYITRDVLSILDITVASGKRGYVAWVNDQWHLVAVASC